MLIYSLTNHIYTTWGVKYSSFNWRPEWYTFLRIQKRELNEIEFHESYRIKTVKYLIFWYDCEKILKEFIWKLFKKRQILLGHFTFLRLCF